MQNKNIPEYDMQMIQKIAVALNALIQKRIKQTDKSDDDEKDASDGYIHGMFASICDNVRYAQINLNDVLSSLLMKEVFCKNKWNNIAFDILSKIFPNICAYF